MDMSSHYSTQAVLVFMKLILSQSWFYLTHSIMINKCDLVMLIREGFKNKKKLVEYSTKGLTPPPPLSGNFFLLNKNDLHVVKRILYDTGRRTVAGWPHTRG